MPALFFFGIDAPKTSQEVPERVKLRNTPRLTTNPSEFQYVWVICSIVTVDGTGQE